VVVAVGAPQGVVKGGPVGAALGLSLGAEVGPQEGQEMLPVICPHPCHSWRLEECAILDVGCRQIAERWCYGCQ